MFGKLITLITAFIYCISFVALANAPAIIAHRGGTGDGPENTVYTIEK